MRNGILRGLQARAFHEAWRGRHSAWFVIGAAIWMINRARSGDGVVYRTKLEPGESLLVTTRRPDSTTPADR